jgi:hypothetical protein
VAPLAVNVIDPPTHIVGMLGITPTAGTGFTVTVTEVVEEQPVEVIVVVRV